MNWVHAFLQCKPFQEEVLQNFETPRKKVKASLNVPSGSSYVSSEVEEKSQSNLSDVFGSFNSQDFSLDFIVLKDGEDEEQKRAEEPTPVLLVGNAGNANVVGNGGRIENGNVGIINEEFKERANEHDRQKELANDDFFDDPDSLEVAEEDFKPIEHAALRSEYETHSSKLVHQKSKYMFVVE